MRKAEDADAWLSNIELASMLSMLRENGATEVLYKILPKNANSKNQVYLGGKDPSEFSKIPSGDMTMHVSTSTKNGKQEAVFRSDLDFYWLTEAGQAAHAPNAKMIFYPQYPEVRFSGFLLGCKDAPSSLWAKPQRGTEAGRILVLGVGNRKKVIGVTLPPESPAAKEILATGPHAPYGAMNILPMLGNGAGNPFRELMAELCKIHKRIWVPSTRLDPAGLMVPCNSSNGNGNTLESLLGIPSNGYSKPDFKGWELKVRQVPNVDKPGASAVTLFTPEPTSGFYTEKGVAEFVRRYGYAARNGCEDRLNFGGIHRAKAAANKRTGLRLVLDGFKSETEYSPAGSVVLLDSKDDVAASWSFVKLMNHWKAKHAQAAFIPVQQRLQPERQYRFGRRILLGEGAEFGLLLRAFHEGKVYYDPGIKLEAASTKEAKHKQRSQFRVRSKNLPALYESSRIVDACDEASS